MGIILMEDGLHLAIQECRFRIYNPKVIHFMNPNRIYGREISRFNHSLLTD